MSYSRIIGEAQMRMMNPSVIVSRLDLVVLELAVAGIVFRRLPLGAPRWVVPPSGHPSGTSSAHLVSFDLE